MRRGSSWQKEMKLSLFFSTQFPLGLPWVIFNRQILASPLILIDQTQYEVVQSDLCAFASLRDDGFSYGGLWSVGERI